MDFIEGLPPSQGKNTILVVVDRLSKSTHFLSLTHLFIAKIVAEKFVEGVIKLHSMPSSIISDHDPIFISNFWCEFFKLPGTQLKMSFAYHPQMESNICAAWFTSNQGDGTLFFSGQNFGIIQPTMLRPACHLFKLYMVDLHL